MRSPTRWVLWTIVATLVLIGLFALWQWQANRAPEVSEDSRPLILWSFESARLAADGSSIEIDAFAPSDPACFEYDHVETAVVDVELVVSLYYLGPEPEQFCEIPCPIGTVTAVVDLEAPVDPSLGVVKNPQTEPHCSESIPS